LLLALLRTSRPACLRCHRNLLLLLLLLLLLQYCCIRRLQTKLVCLLHRLL
jgi:hypothetical protein